MFTSTQFVGSGISIEKLLFFSKFSGAYFILYIN